MIRMGRSSKLLSAVVLATGSSGERQLSIRRLYKGPGESVLAPAEILTGVRVPA